MNNDVAASSAVAVATLSAAAARTLGPRSQTAADKDGKASAGSGDARCAPPWDTGTREGMMRNWGAVLAVLAGFCGIVATAMGLLGDTDQLSEPHLAYRWLSLLFCFLVMVSGALSIDSRDREPVLMICFTALCALTIGEGTALVAMVVALAAGALALLGTPARH